MTEIAVCVNEKNHSYSIQSPSKPFSGNIIPCIPKLTNNTQGHCPFREWTDPIRRQLWGDQRMWGEKKEGGKKLPSLLK